MGSAFHQLCPRYSGTLTPTAPTAIRLIGKPLPYKMLLLSLFSYSRKRVDFETEKIFLNIYTSPKCLILWEMVNSQEVTVY